MNASTNRKHVWIKLGLALVLGLGFLASNTGCDETGFMDDILGGAQNFTGERNTFTNPAGNGIWDDLPFSTTSWPQTSTTTSHRHY